ncbi:MAG: M24 family metallopeptidase [Thermoleophilia bacterium]
MSAREAARQERLLAALEERGIGAMLVTEQANVRYLTGYVGSNGIALVGAAGSVLVTDSRYAVSARAQVQDAEVVIGGRDLLADVAARARDLAGAGPVGIEADTVTLTRHARLAELLGDTPMEQTRGLVEELREVKDPGEVEAMRRAARAVDRALEAVLAGGIVGRTEAEVAFALHGAMLAEGAEGPSFETIVASGPRGARPHHVPGPDRVPPDTLVVIDLGAVVDGYCSDMTRTVATGDLTPRLSEIHEVCLAAQQAALEAARPGMEVRELDAVARTHIADAGYGEHFGHGLGHGVGLAIHERPGVRPEGAGTLRAGMAITIEPGIYIEGEGGVRIEDLVVLGDEATDVLSTSPKELRRVE